MAACSEYDTSGFYDVGTVEINGAATAALPWVNGPSDHHRAGNPARERASAATAAANTASRLDLSSFAGTVTPRFTMNNDNSGQTFIGGSSTTSRSTPA